MHLYQRQPSIECEFDRFARRPGFASSAARASDRGATTVRDYLLALGLVLTPASQLRFNSIPIGPGEACLAVWLVLSLGSEAIQPSVPTRAFWQMTIFWAIFVIAQCLGTLWGMAAGTEYDPVWFLHDVMAYMLLAPICCLSVIRSDSRASLRRVCWGFVTLGTVSLGMQMAHGLELISIPMIDPWFWERFRGWSANPNQLALLCAILGLLAIYLVDTATTRAQRTTAAACLILPILVGRMTGSDTFTLTLLTTGPILFAMKLRSWLRFPGRRLPFRARIAGVLIVTLPFLLVSVMPLAVSLASDPERLAIGLAKNNGKDTAQEADLRLSLWVQALEVGARSALLGLGPGPHLQIPDSIVAARVATMDQPENLAHPTQSSAPNFEAHNTLLDLLTQGGLIAILSFVWLQAKAFVAVYKADSASLVALFAGLCVFGMTGLIIRHPMYWFAVGLCLVEQNDSRQTTVAEV